MFWRLARRAQPLSYRVKGPSRPTPVLEDMAVPPESLSTFLVRMQNVLKRRQITASLLCHAGQGQVHLQPFLNLDDPADVQRMRLAAEELYAEVVDAHGAVSGGHAYGLSRTPFLARQVGPLYEVLREVKRIFDPGNILNPGKIVGDDPELHTRNLCAAIVAPAETAPPAPEGDSPKLRDLIELQLNWDPSRVLEATVACNRCGECRSQAPQVRMCPIFRFAPAEEASPRAKANIIRGILTREHRSQPPGQRRVQGGGRPLRPLPRLPAGVSRRRGHPAADAGEQGRLRFLGRPAAGRLADDAAGPAGRRGEQDQPPGQLGPGQSANALAAGEDAGDRPGPEAAAGGVAEFPSPRGAAATEPHQPPQPAEKSSTSSTRTRTGTTRSWARRWSR